VLALAACLGCATWNEAGPPPRLDAVDRCDAATAARLRFLEGRLARHARYAKRWWRAWNAMYGGGIVFSGTLAGFDDGRGERAGHVVEAVKSGIGLAHNFVAPPVVRDAPQVLAAIDPSAPDGCARRLAQAEEILYRAAEQAHRERRAWRPHLANLALNLGGAAIVAEGFHEGTGWSSGALGLVFGEVHIWSFPWQAVDTLRDYERRFPSARRLGNSDTSTCRTCYGRGAAGDRTGARAQAARPSSTTVLLGFTR
jgi:hypothetical protein